MTIPDNRVSSNKSNEERWKPNIIRRSTILNSIYRTTKEIGAKEELEAYLEESVESAEKDIYKYWKSKSLLWPRLAKMARDYLTIPATTASSERMFNTGKDLIGISRYSLNPSTVECCVTLSSWLKSGIIKLNIADDFEEFDSR